MIPVPEEDFLNKVFLLKSLEKKDACFELDAVDLLQEQIVQDENGMDM